MKKIYRILIFVFSILVFHQNYYGQTLIIDPHAEGGFELGPTFESNGWTLVNYASGTGNNWRLTTTDLSYGGYSFARTGSRAAFISEHATGTTWTYNIHAYSTTHFYRDVSFPAGEELIYLDFRWNAQGEGTASSKYDVLYVYICPPSLTPVTHSPFGTSSLPTAWTGTGTATLIGSYHTNPSMSGTTEHITLPAAYAGTTQRLVFSWKNGNTLGVQPPAAIDSISLRSDCYQPQLLLSNESTPCSGNISLSSTVYFGSTMGTYKWYVNNILIPSESSPSFSSSSLSNGDIVTAVYHSNNACEYTDTASIEIEYGLTVHRTDTLELCSGELPYNWSGIVIPPGLEGVYPEYTSLSFEKPDGCDSIVTLHLTVKASPSPVTETISTCRALLQGLEWRGKSIPADAESHVRFDSVIVHNSTGCDSVIYLDLKVIDSAVSTVNTMRDCDRVTFRGRVYTENSTVTDTFRNMAGCDSFYIFNEIIVDSFHISLEADDTLFIETLNSRLTVSSNYPSFNVLSWEPAYLFPHQHSYIQDFTVPVYADIIVRAENETGCIDTASFKINAVRFDKGVSIPNAFSPNGDGLNDEFRPLFAMDPNFHQIHLSIFDRWGNRMYSHFTKDQAIGWDGTVNSTPAAAGVYYYHIVIYYMDRSHQEYKGDLTLIR